MPFPSEINDFKELTPTQQFNRIACFNYISGSSTYVRASFYKEIGGFDEQYKYFEDYPLYLKLLRSGKPIEFFDRVSIYYRYGTGLSTMNKKLSSYIQAIYDDRILCIEKDIIPYYSNMEWWRKQYIDLKLANYIFERDANERRGFRKYLHLFCISPIGTILHIGYQLRYHLKIKALIA